MFLLVRKLVVIKLLFLIWIIGLACSFVSILFFILKIGVVGGLLFS